MNKLDIIFVISFFLTFIFAVSITIFFYKRDFFGEGVQELILIMSLLVFISLSYLGEALVSLLEKRLSKTTINANKYLEQNYPKDGVCQIDVNNQGKSRAEITELNVDRRGLSGNLDVSDFIQLEKLYCWNNQLTNLILPNNDKLRILSCSNNRLTNLDLAQQVNLEILNCNNNRLTQLTLPNSDKLKWLYCYQNQLTSLDCANNSHLKLLWCHRNQLTQLILPASNLLISISFSDNLLTSFNYPILNPATLMNLSMINNNLPATDIAAFSHLVNLFRLEIGNLDKWVRVGNQGNQFYGSLSSLKNCTKLKDLAISNTNINASLEYLPASLENFHYGSLAGSHCKVKEIENILQQQAILLDKYYDKRNWKRYWNSWISNNGHLIILCIEYETILSQLDLALNCQSLTFKQLTNQFLPIFIFWIEDEIRDLKNKLDAKQLAEVTAQINN